MSRFFVDFAVRYFIKTLLQSKKFYVILYGR